MVVIWNKTQDYLVLFSIFSLFQGCDQHFKRNKQIVIHIFVYGYCYDFTISTTFFSLISKDNYLTQFIVILIFILMRAFRASASLLLDCMRYSSLSSFTEAMKASRVY